VLDGFTITGGYALGTAAAEDAHGGGVLLDGFDSPASATISRCDISGNSAEFGGGVGMVFQSSVALSGESIHDNVAEQGGGLECGAAGCTVTGSTFHANTGWYGGAIYATSLLVLANDTFTGNHASYDGGAVDLEIVPGTSLTDVVFQENTAAGQGGALAAFGTDYATIANGLFVGNLGGTGGAIVTNTALELLDVTMTRNDATVTGGDALDWTSGVPAFELPTIANTIIWGNPEDASGTDVVPASWTAISAWNSDLRSYSGPITSNFDADPQLVSLPLFFDAVTAVGTTGDVVVADSSRYTTGDVLEIAGDGIARTVSSASAGHVSYSPALATAAPAWTVIRDWGATLGTLDAHLADGSPCIDKGDSTVAPSTDLDGAARVGAPDVGAYEHL
jgi:predicted outer membrane repeat protein